MAVVLLAGVQNGTGPLGMVGAVGELLTLQAYAHVLRIVLAELADDVLLAINSLEVAAVYLYARLIGEHLHEDTGLGAIE